MGDGGGAVIWISRRNGHLIFKAIYKSHDKTMVDFTFDFSTWYESENSILTWAKIFVISDKKGLQKKWLKLFMQMIVR